MFNKNINYTNIILFISISILTYFAIKKKLKRMDKYKDYINQNQNV
jgi:preprotein translocase subunit YajC